MRVAFRSAAFALIALFSFATDGAAAPLTLDQALEEAEAASDRLRLQEQAVRMAASEPLADPRASSPSLRLGVRDIEGSGGNYTSSPGNPEFVARARVPLPRPWDLATASREGAATVDREQAQYDAVRADIRLDVTRMFHALPLMEEALALAQRLTQVTVEHRELVNARRAEGLATELEWLDSEEQRRDADQDRAALGSDLRIARSEFALLLGRPAGTVIEIERTDAEARALAVEGTPDSFVASVLERSPAAAAARADIERANQRMLRVQLRGLPWLDWFEGGVVLGENERPKWAIGAAIDIPFTLWGPARSREAQLDLASARIRLEAVERRVSADAMEKVRDAAAAREQWLVERNHHHALVDHAEPILALVDSLVKLQLQARLVRAELREVLALIGYLRRLDELDAQGVP